MFRVLICGDRNWTNEKVIKAVVAEFPEDTVVIEGGCRGADEIGSRCAKERGLAVEEYPADWKLGKRAGPIRNQKMIDALPECVFAFHNDITKSKGTKNMIKLAEANEIPVILISETEENVNKC